MNVYRGRKMLELVSAAVALCDPVIRCWKEAADQPSVACDLILVNVICSEYSGTCCSYTVYQIPDSQLLGEPSLLNVRAVAEK